MLNQFGKIIYLDIPIPYSRCIGCAKLENEVIARIRCINVHYKQKTFVYLLVT